MTRTAAGFLGLLVLLPALRGRGSTETATPAQQYRKLVQEFEKAQVEFGKALVKAKTREDQQKVMEEKNQQLASFAPRFVELAEKNSKDPAAVDALIWVVVRGHGGLRTKAMNLLLRDHIQSERMATVLPPLAYTFQDKDIQKLLRAVLEKSKRRPAQAQACLTLAQGAENRLNLARRFQQQPGMAKAYEAILGKETVAALVKSGPEGVHKEAEAFYERAVRDFADVADPDGGTVGEKAKEKLEGLRHPILVGKPAPDIEGEDIDGKRFKLSDYRGKVVLLDFWGHW
jgi:hypothetical protein